MHAMQRSNTRRTASRPLRHLEIEIPQSSHYSLWARRDAVQYEAIGRSWMMQESEMAAEPVKCCLRSG